MRFGRFHAWRDSDKTEAIQEPCPHTGKDDPENRWKSFRRPYHPLACDPGLAYLARNRASSLSTKVCTLNGLGR